MRERRREFLRQACGALAGSAALAASLRSFGLVEALAGAQGASDYKALVCLFLNGGNDGHNTLVPRDASEYNLYAAARGELAIPRDQLLPIKPPSQHGLEFGFHPNCAEMQSLFNAKRLAVICNTGTLVEPVTRAQVQSRAAPVPDNLFSHPDQVAQWQSAISERTGEAKLTGWGGRIADRLASANVGAQFPMLIAPQGGGGLLLSGEKERAYVPSSFFEPFTFLDSEAEKQHSRQALKQMLAAAVAGSETPHQRAAAQTINDALAFGEKVRELAPLQFPYSSAFTTPFGASQFQSIAKMIWARERFNLRRQIFFVRLDGFDTHNNQGVLTGTQPNLMKLVSGALKDFYNATELMGVSSQVTTFVLSDFGRTLKPAAGAGTDHGWGNQLFVVGGAVRGGDFYGRYPVLAPGGPDDADTSGRFIPTTSVEQYAATLASWFGLGDAEVRSVFPNIGRFASTNLGFMG